MCKTKVSTPKMLTPKKKKKEKRRIRTTSKKMGVKTTELQQITTTPTSQKAKGL